MINQLKIISANIRGFQTNIGDLTHSFVIPNRIDIVATVETFLNETVPENYGHIRGYSRWHRRDRIKGTFGGIAVCFRNSLCVQPLDVNPPDHLEMMFFKILVTKQEAVLLCVCYRPQWQGSEPLLYLQNNLDSILQDHSCQRVIIVGDLNYYLVASAFNELLTVHGLDNHVDFPTHISGSSLDPVLTDFPEYTVKCSAMGNVGSSDHTAILTTVNTAMERDEPINRTIWLWHKADWTSLRKALENTDWNQLLTGNVDDQTVALTNHLITLQEVFVPHKSYKSKPGDQAWFKHNCRIAADKKSRAWKKYKRHPTEHNKVLHRSACKEMESVQRWAIQRWHDDLKGKLTDRSMGTKQWWSSIKQQQGLKSDDAIPPLNKSDGTVATSNVEKAELLATHFSRKMTVPDPLRHPPVLHKRTCLRLTDMDITNKQVKQLLLSSDINKASGPDNISPHTLKMCASELAQPLVLLFKNCIHQQRWPSLWKSARVVAVHKKNSRTLPENYRPISLLSGLGKIFEKVLVSSMGTFLEDNHLLSLKQFGFRKNRSASDLLLNMTANWNKSLDSNKDTYVIALDIAGAFDCVWHQGLVEKLQSLGIEGNLLSLLKDYLHGRSLHVAVNGHSSSELPVGASVPQGSVLGPLLWNIYFDDILQLISEASAYADDCTLTFTCARNQHRETIHHINHVLELIIAWGERWQVTLAPEKTQFMCITRNQSTPLHDCPPVQLHNKILTPQKEIEILGVKFNKDLTFTGHVRQMAKRAANKLACVRRISYLLDGTGCATLYKSQVRSVMEYSPLVWSSCPPSYLNLLDKIQERAQRLIQYKMEGHERPTNLQPLQQRRDVSGMCVLYKAQRQHTPHLAPLRLPLPPPSHHGTRAAQTRSSQVEIPFARTELFLRSFHSRYSRMWNTMVHVTHIDRTNSMHMFKREVNAWIRLQN